MKIEAGSASFPPPTYSGKVITHGLDINAQFALELLSLETEIATLEKEGLENQAAARKGSLERLKMDLGIIPDTRD